MPFSKRWTVLLITATALSLGSAPTAEAQIYQIGLILERAGQSGPRVEILNAATTAFLDSKRFDVIERSRLDAMFTERDLQDFIDGTPGDLSDLEGVDLLGLVSFSIEAGTAGARIYYIDVRIFEVRTGRTFATISSRRNTFEPPASPHLAGLYLLENIRETFPPEGIVVIVSGPNIIIDLGVESGLKKGDELEVVREGEVFFHPVTGDRMPAVETVVGVLRVKKPSHQMSTCVLKKNKDTPPIQVKDRVRLRPKYEMLRKIYSRIPFVKNKIKNPI